MQPNNYDDDDDEIVAKFYNIYVFILIACKIKNIYIFTFLIYISISRLVRSLYKLKLVKNGKMRNGCKKKKNQLIVSSSFFNHLNPILICLLFLE